MATKTVLVKPHKRSTPSPTPRKNPDAPKPKELFFANAPLIPYFDQLFMTRK